MGCSWFTKREDGMGIRGRRTDVITTHVAGFGADRVV